MFVLKKISRTSRPISIKLGTNHPWVKEILDYTNKGPGPLQRKPKKKNCVFRVTQPTLKKCADPKNF
jgi:hypothetical protein